MAPIDPAHVQFLALAVFGIGLATVLSRRNLFAVLMGVELMLNAANLSIIGFSRQFAGQASLDGHLIPLFTIAVAAAGACVGLAMVICITRNKDTVDGDQFAEMKE